MTQVTVMYVSSTYKAMTFARTHRNAASSAGGIRGERMQNLGECYRSKEEKKRKREKEKKRERGDVCRKTCYARNVYEHSALRWCDA